MIILDRTEIEALIDPRKAATAIEAAYRAASAGRVNLPPVGHITFAQDADCHIKYGHVLGDDIFVIKVATGFPGNAALGLETGNGVTLVMSALTGALRAVLHDEMLMTDIRTGLGGAIATRALARADNRRIVVLGTGIQAARQIEAHAALLGPDITFEVWGRSTDRTADLVTKMAGSFAITQVNDLQSSLAKADVIVTTTASNAPLFPADWIKPGTHITAVGADAPGKQELDPGLVARADVRVADLCSQSLDHGEFCHVARSGAITGADVFELGAVLDDASLGRRNDAHITIADLTGIAAQDIAIAGVVLAAHAAATPTA